MQHDKKEKMILEALSSVLSELRINNAKSQRILAFENGMHKSMISRFESCKNEPRIFSVWKVANAFGLKPSEFLSLIENKLPQDFNLIDD